MFYSGGLFNLIFLLAFGIIAFSIFNGLREWNQNNHSPRLTVDATVVSKRTNVSHHHGNAGTNAGMHTTTSTTYYVTFQVASGDRMELCVKGHEFGILVEGDYGALSFQGTRYLGFQRYS
ncbi:MAG: DUF2500 domain-containing protein [bacterium]|nr:DUF2500 domain-containing protein [bacterium]